MKRLIVCCDGTWQSQDNNCPTNVLKIAQAIKPIAEKDNVTQILYYDQGIGAVPSRGGTQSLLKNIGNSFEKLAGGTFGWSIDEKIEDAYIFLCLNYCPGDEIYLFGFSRGAYTVRSLAGLIDCSGLLKRPDIDKTNKAYQIYRIGEKEKRKQEAKKFRDNNADRQVDIKLLGCWDTVGALGVPNLIPWLLIDEVFNVKYVFHNTTLSPIIQNALHAIAIDEKREAFNVSIMEPGENFKGKFKQVWFPGDHGCVGGGTKEQSGLADIALRWMINESEVFGLEFDKSAVPLGIKSDATIPFDNTLKGIFALTKSNLREVSHNWEDLHESVIQRWIETNSNSPSEKMNPKTNLPYNPENLLSKHKDRLVEERNKSLTQSK